VPRLLLLLLLHLTILRLMTSRHRKMTEMRLSADRALT